MLFDKEQKVESRIEKFVHTIEYIIAIILIIGMLIGLLDLVHYFKTIFEATPANAYEEFHDFLGHALLLIVGAELILMILYHSTSALLELILFVIARKMLIYSETLLDLVIGTVALAIVFLIIKYLLEDDGGELMSKGDKKKSEEIIEEKPEEVMEE